MKRFLMSAAAASGMVFALGAPASAQEPGEQML